MKHILTYQLMTEVNHGTEEEPNIVQIFSPVKMECDDSNYDSAMALAQREAYNGDIQIEDIPDDPETEIANLKAKLSSTDYKAIKYAEGWITEEEYAPIKEERQAIRDRINELEAQMANENAAVEESTEEPEETESTEPTEPTETAKE